MKKLFSGLLALTLFVGSAVAMEAPRSDLVKIEISNQNEYFSRVTTYDLDRNSEKSLHNKIINPHDSLEFHLDKETKYVMQGSILKGNYFELILEPRQKFLRLLSFDSPGAIHNIRAAQVDQINNPTDVLLIINPDGSLCLVDRSGMKK